MSTTNLKLLSVSLRNFKSYGNNLTTINLDTSKTIAIVGKNYDSIVDAQISSNGAGKTSALKAIIYCIYDKLNSDENKNELINDINQKNMEVILDFYKNNIYYRIHRYRAFKAKNSIGKSGNGCFLLRKSNLNQEWIYKGENDGGHDITKTSGDLDKLIVDIIGFPFDVFSKIILSSSNDKPFLQLNLSEQKDIIEELLGYTELSKKADILHKTITKDRIDLENLQILNEQIKLERERYYEYHNNISQQYNNWNIESSINFKKLEDQLKNYNENYKNINFIEQEQYLDKLSQLSLDFLQLNEKINILKSQIVNIDENIEKYNQWNKNQKDKITIAKQELNIFLDKYKNINFDKEEEKLNKLVEIKENLNVLNKTLDSLNSDFSKNSKLINDYNLWENNHINELTTIETILSNLNPVFYNKKEIEEFNSILLKLDNKIIKTQNDNVVINEKINNKSKESIKNNKKIEDLKLFIDEIRKNKCPTCSQEFLLNKEKLLESETAYDLFINEEQQCQYTIESLKKLELENLANIKTCLEDKKNIIIYIFGTDQIDIELEYEKTNNFEKLNSKLEFIKQDKNPFGNEETIKVIKEHLSKTEIAIVEITDNISVIKSEFDKIDNSLFFKNLIELNNIVNKKENLYNNLDLVKDEINPYFNPEQLKIIKVERENLDLDLENLLFDMKNTSEDIKKYKDLIKFTDVKELTTIKLTEQNLKQEIDRLKNAINPYNETLKNINENLPSNLKDSDIDELHNTIQHKEFLYKLLTKKDSFIRKALLNRYLPFLNERIKFYLTKLGLPFNVEFQQDMSVKISQFKTEKKYTGLSNGQQARIDIALSVFAFRDVLRYRCGDVNLWILDEVLDNKLCNVGIQLATKLMKNIAKENNLSLYVISHRSEIESMFDEQLKIELKNGFSNIVS